MERTFTITRIAARVAGDRDNAISETIGPADSLRAGAAAWRLISKQWAASAAEARPAICVRL
jgi:hypothetical protein